jgi:hypothetical protein
MAAAGIDLAHDALTGEARLTVRSLDDTDELVADRSREICITANDLEVGIADAGYGDANECFAIG